MFPRELVPLVRDLKACMRPESRRKGGGGAQTLENTVMSETGLKFKVNVYYASFLVTWESGNSQEHDSLQEEL